MISKTTGVTAHRLWLPLILALVLAIFWSTAAYAAGPGDLDPTFNGTGVVTTAISLKTDIGYSVALQPNNKIIVAGASSRADDPFDFAFAAVRYNSDGSLDTTFNGAGVVTTSIGTSDIGYSVLVQPDNKIVVAGESISGSGPFPGKFAVVRYNSNGSLDTTFNSTGIVTTSIVGSNPVGLSAALQSDGKIVVGGVSSDGSINAFTVVRYNSDGSLDTTFNSAGIVTTSIETNDTGLSVAIQSDNKIVLAGVSNNTGDPGYRFALVRYNSDGSLDTSFNSTGIVTTSIDVADAGYAVALQPDDKIVLAGVSNPDSSTLLNGYLAIARYNNDGSLDASFNSTGVVTTSLNNVISTGVVSLDIALQPNGKIVVTGGDETSPSNADFLIVRYNSDGSLDTSFNGDGIVTTPIGNSSDVAFSVAVQPDGKIVAAGGIEEGASTYRFAVARYLGDDLLQPSFYLPLIMKNVFSD